MNSNNEKTPVFVMTNLDEGNVTSEALKSGADKCFLKAKFTPKQIVEEVEYFLKKPSGDSLSDK
jgi:DNA-binding response OmpR family regulator